MRSNYIAFVLFAGLMAFTASLTAQPVIPGIYSMDGGSHDPQGGTNLVIAPDSIFAVAGFGVMEPGMWDAYKNYLILEPSPLLEEDFYVIARHNPEQEGVYMQFDGFTAVSSLYSFDNGDFTGDMHPVFNPWPNCTSYPYYTVFEKGEHASLQLAAYIPGTDDRGTVLCTYDFALADSYNEYIVIAVERESSFRDPLLLVIDGETLSVDGSRMSLRTEYDEMREEEKNMLTEMGALIRQKDAGKVLAEHYGYDFAEPLGYGKQTRRITFDGQNLFEASCVESTAEGYETLPEWYYLEDED